MPGPGWLVTSSSWGHSGTSLPNTSLGNPKGDTEEPPQLLQPGDPCRYFVLRLVPSFGFCTNSHLPQRTAPKIPFFHLLRPDGRRSLALPTPTPRVPPAPRGICCPPAVFISSPLIANLSFVWVEGAGLQSAIKGRSSAACTSC